MEWLWDIDWLTTFVPSVPPLEIVLRGTIVYLLLFVLLGSVLRREMGRMNIADL